MSNIEKFIPSQILCIESFCMNPTLTYKELAEICDVHKATIVRWMKTPKIINAIYDNKKIIGVDLPEDTHI